VGEQYPFAWSSGANPRAARQAAGSGSCFTGFAAMDIYQRAANAVRPYAIIRRGELKLENSLDSFQAIALGLQVHGWATNARALHCARLVQKRLTAVSNNDPGFCTQFLDANALLVFAGVMGAEMLADEWSKHVLSLRDHMIQMQNQVVAIVVDGDSDDDADDGGNGAAQLVARSSHSQDAEVVDEVDDSPAGADEAHDERLLAELSDNPKRQPWLQMDRARLLGELCSYDEKLESVQAARTVLSVMVVRVA
jgi:hypothetical protein